MDSVFAAIIECFFSSIRECCQVFVQVGLHVYIAALGNMNVTQHASYICTQYILEVC